MTDSGGIRSYTVVGMTCGHCQAAVAEEIGSVAGVTSVDVDLTSGRVAVSGAGFTDAAIKGAVEEAGYEVAAGPG